MSDVLDYVFPMHDEPASQRCSGCRRWFLSGELDYCERQGELICLGCSSRCEECGDRLCPACYGSREACTACYGDWLDRMAR